MIKKFGLFIFGLVSLGLINYGNSMLYSCSYYSNDEMFENNNDGLQMSKSSMEGHLVCLNGDQNSECMLNGYGISYGEMECVFVDSNFSLDSIYGGDCLGGVYCDFGGDISGGGGSCESSHVNFYWWDGELPFRGHWLYSKELSAGEYFNMNIKGVVNTDFIFSGNYFTGQGNLNGNPYLEILSNSCDYSGYESQINTLSGNLAICEGMYERLETDYDLLSGNYNTCTSELNSCMSGGSSGSGDVQWSSLFINNVQHLGNKNIYIDIPLDYEYSYTNEGENFELDVLGLNQDEEYIEGIINIQNYKPSSEDFTKLVGMLAPYTKYLVFLLFIFIIWAWIKKPFKSKKL